MALTGLAVLHVEVVDQLLKDVESALSLRLRTRGCESVEFLFAQLAPRVGRGGPDDLLVVLLKQIVEVFVRIARVEQFVAAALFGVVEEVAETVTAVWSLESSRSGKSRFSVLVRRATASDHPPG